MNTKWLRILGMIAILASILYMKFSLDKESGFFKLFAPTQNEQTK